MSGYILNSKSEIELDSFLSKYENPEIVTASTIKDGFVECIQPFTEICVAEIICNQRTKSSVIKFILDWKSEKQ